MSTHLTSVGGLLVSKINALISTAMVALSLFYVGPAYGWAFAELLAFAGMCSLVLAWPALLESAGGQGSKPATAYAVRAWLGVLLLLTSMQCKLAGI